MSGVGFMEDPEECDYGEQLYNWKDTMFSLKQASGSSFDPFSLKPWLDYFLSIFTVGMYLQSALGRQYYVYE